MTSIAPIHSLRSSDNESISDIKEINGYLMVTVNIIFTAVSVFAAIMYFFQHENLGIKVLLSATIAIFVAVGEIILLYIREERREKSNKEKIFIDRSHDKVIRNWPIPIPNINDKKNN